MIPVSELKKHTDVVEICSKKDVGQICSKKDVVEMTMHTKFSVGPEHNLLLGRCQRPMRLSLPVGKMQRLLASR